MAASRRPSVLSQCQRDLHIQHSYRTPVALLRTLLLAALAEVCWDPRKEQAHSPTEELVRS